jgi:serine/threonine protein kinase
MELEVQWGAKVGKGAFGEVHRAVHKDTGEALAVKSLPVRRVHEGLPRSLMQEVEALRGLSHPNLTPLRGVFPVGDRVCLATPMYAGDVEALIRSNAQHTGCSRLPLPLVKVLAQQAASGLAALHLQSIIHRDVKMSNFLLSSNGTVALCDMGLATIIDQRANREGLSANAGSKCYRAPELALGSTQYGFGVDIWALGCVLAELLEGEPLFPSTGDIGLIGQITDFLGCPKRSDMDENTLRALPPSGRVWLASEEQEEQSAAHLELGWKERLKALVPEAPPDCLDLLERCLVYREGGRIAASDIKAHNFFVSWPRPSTKEELAAHLLGRPVEQ